MFLLASFNTCRPKTSFEKNNFCLIFVSNVVMVSFKFEQKLLTVFLSPSVNMSLVRILGLAGDGF